MAELKDAWTQTAKSFVLALNDLGISLGETLKFGVDKAVTWARTDNPHIQTDGVEVNDPQPAQAPSDPTE